MGRAGGSGKVKEGRKRMKEKAVAVGGGGRRLSLHLPLPLREKRGGLMNAACLPASWGGSDISLVTVRKEEEELEK